MNPSIKKAYNFVDNPICNRSRFVKKKNGYEFFLLTKHRDFCIQDEGKEAIEIMYQIILKGGVIIDPSQKFHKLGSVAIRDGKIAAID